MARTLLEKISDVGQVGLSVRLLVLLYQKHDALNALAHGVVESISGLDGSPDPGQISSTWRDIWRQEAGSLHEFGLALRLMDSAARFLADRDLRVLLDLPHEDEYCSSRSPGSSLSKPGPTADLLQLFDRLVDPLDHHLLEDNLVARPTSDSYEK